ncbi:MAG: hypothetical protein IPJ13_20945 [Saprospiraceae bacterium]|nr:hypothetical protein [Saprospiraceae bacterium]
MQIKITHGRTMQRYSEHDDTDPATPGFTLQISIVLRMVQMATIMAEFQILQELDQW